MAEKIIIGNAELWHGDCQEVIPLLPKVDCVITDPPYFKVKDYYWDNAWENSASFLCWIEKIINLLADCVKFNGSVYFFASPQMAANIEVLTQKRLNVLAHIVWRKGRPGMRETSLGNKANKESLRSYFMTTERIIFSEHYNSDNCALGESNYFAACDQVRSMVFEPLRAYLASEWKRAGLSSKDANACTSSHMATHWFTESQWALPTRENYEKLRAFANAKNEGVFFAREYEYLRREYEDLRREYEDLRRPFFLSSEDQWYDVWDFDPVQAYSGKHPCEKPLAILAHMLKASTKPDMVVLDAFMGSGSTGDACAKLNRRFIGIEKDRKYFDQACERIARAQAQGVLFSPGPQFSPVQETLL